MLDDAKARRTSILALQSSKHVQSLRKTFSAGSRPREIPPFIETIWPEDNAENDAGNHGNDAEDENDEVDSDDVEEKGLKKLPFVRRYRCTSEVVPDQSGRRSLQAVPDQSGRRSLQAVPDQPGRRSVQAVPIYTPIIKEKVHFLHHYPKRRSSLSGLLFRSADLPTAAETTLAEPQRALSVSDSHLENRQDEDSKKGNKGKNLRKNLRKKLKDEVYTPVMERVRRVSVSMQETFSKTGDFDSDNEDDDDKAFNDIFGQIRPRRNSNVSTDSDFSFDAAGSGSIQRHHSYEPGSPKSSERIRQRRKSAAGFLMSYAANKIKSGIGSRVDEFETEWYVDEELEQWQHPHRESYPAVDTHVGDLHPKELQCLQGISAERYNDRETGTTAVLPKDPSRKKKRSSSFKRKSDKERTKLVAGGIFGVPLNVVLEIDAMNGGRNDTLIRCIRDKKRKNKTPVLTPNDSPKLTRRFGSLKSRSASPLVSPILRRRPNSTIIGYSNSSLDINNEHMFSRSLSTPTTPLDTRKIRTVSSTSAIFSTDDRHVDQYLMNDLMYKLKNSGSTDSLRSTGHVTGQVTTTLEVPQIIINSCEFIEEHGLEMLGLFRICGAKKDIRALRSAFSACSNLTITPDTKSHVVAGLLKEFMKELPEALMTKQLYYPFLYVRRLSERSQRLEAYKELITLLPQANRDTLQYLLNFFSKVTSRSEDTINKDGRVIAGNKMNSKNLATMIGPNLLHRRKAGSSESKNLVIEEAWEFNNVIEVTQELFEFNQALFTVDAVTRQFVLQRMYNTKQSDLEKVLNDYTGSEEYNEGLRGDHDGSPHSPELDSTIRKHCQSEEKRGSLMINGSSGFVSGGCGSNSSIPEEDCSSCSSKDHCRRGFCDRQHSSPELSSIKLVDLKEKRLSRSLDQSTDNPIFTMDTTLKETDTLSDDIASVDSSYDLTPPGSPIFSKVSDRRSLLCRSGLKKAPTTSIAGHAALPPNVTFTKFGIDKIPVVGSSQDSTSQSSATSLTNSNLSTTTSLTNSNLSKTTDTFRTNPHAQLRRSKNVSSGSCHESEV